VPRHHTNDICEIDAAWGTTAWQQFHNIPWRRRGEEDVAPTHNLGTRWGEWSASRPGHALPPGKGSPVPTVMSWQVQVIIPNLKTFWIKFRNLNKYYRLY
jgi:hypothetical protein